MIIGITGLTASGKDMVAHYFVEKGFQHISLADILRKEAQRRGLPLTRANLVELGTQLKEEVGYNVLADRALKHIKKNAVITSIRHPAEVTLFQKLPTFKLVYVRAPVKLRFKRAKLRARPGDSTDSFAQFLKLEKAERDGGGGQALDEVISMADYTIDNSKDLSYLSSQLDRFLIKLKNDHKN